MSFEAKAKEIEIGLAVEEEKEKRWLDEDQEAVVATENVAVHASGRKISTSDKDIGEVQPEKIYISHGKCKYMLIFS